MTPWTNLRIARNYLCRPTKLRESSTCLNLSRWKSCLLEETTSRGLLVLTRSAKHSSNCGCLITRLRSLKVLTHASSCTLSSSETTELRIGMKLPNLRNSQKSRPFCLSVTQSTVIRLLKRPHHLLSREFLKLKLLTLRWFLPQWERWPKRWIDEQNSTRFTSKAGVG